MISPLRLSLLILPLYSQAVLASSEFVIVYEQHPLTDSQSERLSVLLERPVTQIQADSFEAIDTYLKERQVDLMLVSKNHYRQLPQSKVEVIDGDIDWKMDNWQYVDKETVSSHRFYPYSVDFTSLAINVDMLPESLISNWTDAWDTQWSDQIAITKDYQSLFVVALDMLGYDLDTTNPLEIHSAYKLLKSWLPNIHEISSSTEIEMAFLSGEIVVGMSTSSGVYSVTQEGSPMKMLWDLDPIIRTTYGFTVPTGALSREKSIEALNWLVTGSNAAEYALSYRRVSAIAASNDILPAYFTGDPNLYPPADKSTEFRNLEEYSGKTELYKEYFDALCEEHEQLAY
ncbi:extracellular solute-binding protein [Vibrio ulleungensis]|uniref:Extracellular solute-binding protein n=1 Tax=Vibrio ulleungensis TaxID=2807619 RepID=A0ABS2HI22_9VIBR|nr:extracellular solute-binding protein [Vibrio ulleungensis]MBM7035813.1 extracellular solute-binding protein [Vibrio ulleungensis]